MNNKTEYTEISRAQVTKKRDIVISNCSRGGFTIAQQVAIEEDGDNTKVFMKGAFHVGDLSGLYNLRDAINYAIQKVEDNEYDGEPLEDSDIWDE